MNRNEEITAAYFDLLDKHLADLIAGRVTSMMELGDIARALFISPQHLSQTIKLTKGQHPCYFYDEKILAAACRMLNETDMPVADIAHTLTYDPSNFSKFFKKYTGQTPGAYRSINKK